MIALPWWALWLLASLTCMGGWILCAIMSKVESPLYNNDLDESHARVRYEPEAPALRMMTKDEHRELHKNRNIRPWV